VRNENGYLLAGSQKYFKYAEEHFSQLLNVHDVGDVRQIEIHMAESIVLGPSRLEVEIAIANLKKYKSPGRRQICGIDSNRRRNITVYNPQTH
jgi:hypothetical protein